MRRQAEEVFTPAVDRTAVPPPATEELIQLAEGRDLQLEASVRHLLKELDGRQRPASRVRRGTSGL